MNFGVFQFGPLLEGRPNLLKAFPSILGAQQSLGETLMDWPKGPADHGSIYSKTTLLNPKYKNNTRVIRMYLISDLQFHFSCLKS